MQQANWMYCSQHGRSGQVVLTAHVRCKELFALVGGRFSRVCLVLHAELATITDSKK